MPKLSEDIYSLFYNRKTGSNKERILFGRKGEEVTIISDHDNVLIVEGKNKNRYPIKKTKIILT
jgi:hypothetical protein